MGVKEEKKNVLQLCHGPVPKITPHTTNPIVYLSHSIVHTKELWEEFLDKTGAKYFCCSFVYLHPKMIYWTPRAFQVYKVNVERGNHLMMDSGAFSFYMFMAKHKNIPNKEALTEKTLSTYIEFCHKRQKQWDFYVTFDHIRDVKVIWDVTKRLEKEGLKPIPIYHGDQSLDWLRRYLDAGYQRIGIATLHYRRSRQERMRFYLDNVFDIVEKYKGVKTHGFAMTSLSLMFSYPWTSVDSSSWSRTSSFGAIFIVDHGKNTMKTCHISFEPSTNSNSYSRLAKGAQIAIKEQVENRGFDFELMRRSVTYRHIYNGWLFSHLGMFKQQIQRTHSRVENIFA